MYKSIKSFLDTRKQSDKLKSEIEQRAKELKQKSQIQLGYRVGQIDPKKQEELALRIAKAQKIKDPFIEKVENIKVFEIFPNKLAEIKSRNFYQSINRNSEDKIKDFSTPINDLMPPTSKEYSEDIKDKIKNVLNRTSEAQKDILKNHSLISDLNYILSVDKNHHLPKGKPDEKVYKNSRVYKSSDSFQIMKFGRPNLKFTINKWLVKIGLSKKNLIELKKKFIINLQTKLYFPITKFSKYLEKRIFLSKLTEKTKRKFKTFKLSKR